MKTIDVIRATPPEIGHCRHAACGAAVEWVRTVARGKRMPLDHPVHVIRSETRLVDGVRVTTVDSGASHFATCPAASLFRRPTP